MNKHPHILEQTKGNDRPGQVIFFDTETEPVPDGQDQVKHVLKIGVGQHYRTDAGRVLTLRDEVVFRQPDSFLDWLDKRLRTRSTCYLVAHNIVYDLCMIDAWRELPARGWVMKSFYTRGAVSIFRWTNGTRHIIGLDSMNLFAGPLVKWGPLVGLPKLEIDFATATDGDLITYCRRDVEIIARLFTTWLQFLHQNSCGAFKGTVGATAFNTWRHSYMTAKVWVHTDPLALTLERAAYRGARVEVLFKGKVETGPIYYLDVNNLYGYAMSRYEYPAGLLGVTEHANISFLLRKLAKYPVIARVALSVNDNPYPHKFDNRTCYPVGRFITVLTTPELILAIQRGWLVGVDYMAWYRGAPLFRSYINKWYNKRLEYRKAGNQGYEEICKLLINSLYGKFGQVGYEQRIVGDVDISEVYSMTHYNAETLSYGRMLALGGKLYEETRQGESYNSLPSIAAHITAYGRLHLWRLIKAAGQLNCYYVDTDALLVNQAGWDNLRGMIGPLKLGALKPVCVSQWADIRAPKDYALEGREHVKGIRSDAVQIGEGVYSQDEWDGLSGMLQSGDVGNYHVRKIIKHQARRVYSGTVQASGWVLPFQLAEFELVDRTGELLPVLRPQLFEQ